MSERYCYLDSSDQTLRDALGLFEFCTYEHELSSQSCISHDSQVQLHRLISHWSLTVQGLLLAFPNCGFLSHVLPRQESDDAP
jgi:hypothetical protein